MKEGASDATPRIEFPCAYPVKIVGESRDDFARDVVELTRLHAPEITDADVSIRPSREGNYCSVTITIRATGAEQLRDLHATLKAHPLVRLVL
jgi:putative lipoic acid-binding regulatory protein